MTSWTGTPGTHNEHRTTGPRARCFDCNEWCYPTILCNCCNAPNIASWLHDIDNALTNPAVTKAELAFADAALDHLCTHLGHNRDTLEPRPEDGNYP